MGYFFTGAIKKRERKGFFMEVIFLKCIIVVFTGLFLTLYFWVVAISAMDRKKYKKAAKIKGWQMDRLHELVNERLDTIYRNGTTISRDEKDVLEKFLENSDEAIYWDELAKTVNDRRIYSFINVALMDSLYTSPIDTVDTKNTFLQNLFIMDCVNGGIRKFDGRKPVCFPYGMDMKETLQLVVNNQKTLTETQQSALAGPIALAWKERSPETYEKYKNETIRNNFSELISSSAMEKTMSELINKKYVKDLSSPAKYVISKVILEIIANTVYSGNDYRQLANDHKIYLRILATVVANQPYDDIYEMFQKN